jgi:hypothetical protein
METRIDLDRTAMLVRKATGPNVAGDGGRSAFPFAP